MHITIPLLLSVFSYVAIIKEGKLKEEEKINKIVEIYIMYIYISYISMSFQWVKKALVPLMFYEISGRGLITVKDTGTASSSSKISEDVLCDRKSAPPILNVYFFTFYF